MTGLRSIPFGRPWITEQDRRAVLEVLSGHILTHGPQGTAFEEEFARFLGGQAHCVTVSSCAAALHLAYIQMGIGPEDEVIVPAQTHAATAHAVELVGARPVFVDCEPDTGNIGRAGIEAAITPRTKALSLVHFEGIPCEMEGILEVARGHGLKVVEDCALAVGGRYGDKHVGLFGEVGCFSFYPVKHLTTGEGGMLVTRHEEVAEAVRRMRAHGVDRTHRERSLPGVYDVAALGLNYRMSEMQAALGQSQLARMPENLRRREENFTRLKAALCELENVSVIDTVNERSCSGHYCLSVVLRGRLKEHRRALVERLNGRGVGTSVYYPHPVPRMSYYRNKYGYRAEAYPQAERISDHSIALPVGPQVETEDMDYIAGCFKEAVKEIGA